MAGHVKGCGGAGRLRTVGAEIPASRTRRSRRFVRRSSRKRPPSYLWFGILWKRSAWCIRLRLLFGLFLVPYGIERFLIEFVRAWDDSFVFGLMTSQVLSLLPLAAAAYL